MSISLRGVRILRDGTVNISLRGLIYLKGWDWVLSRECRNGNRRIIEKQNVLNLDNHAYT